MINKIQDSIINEFEHLTDYLNRFSYFRHLKKVSGSENQLGQEQKTDENLVTGCSKKLWLTASSEDGKVYFKANSDHHITNGLANLVLKVYSGNTASTITNADLYFLNEIKLYNYLSATGLNDLLSIVKRVKQLAIKQHLIGISK